MNRTLTAFFAVVLGVSSAMSTASAAPASGPIEINGAPLDVAGLSQVLAAQRGRYWWDPSGNVGLEGGPMLFNFYWVLQQQRNAAGGTYKPGARPGESTYVGKGCVMVHGRLRASDESSSTSYYVGC